VVVNFLFANLEQKQIIVGLFEARDMSGVAMDMKLKQILDKFSPT
jgi:hypothetical protein